VNNLVVNKTLSHVHRNVLGAMGSVVPLRDVGGWMGLPVTHEEVHVAGFMTISRPPAESLLVRWRARVMLCADWLSASGITDLARRMVKLRFNRAPTHTASNGDVEIQITGLARDAQNPRRVVLIGDNPRNRRAIASRKSPEDF
jgi:FlaA1/EpsC-like NDP-sugar epimerase